jgi:hypothetical protein
MNIPVLGALFRFEEVQQEESDLLIMVTPHIERAPASEAGTTLTDGRRSGMVQSPRVRGLCRFQPRRAMHFSFRTAGESHGPGLVALVEGVPAGLELLAERDIDGDLRRRQGGTAGAAAWPSSRTAPSSWPASGSARPWAAPSRS